MSTEAVKDKFKRMRAAYQNLFLSSTELLELDSLFWTEKGLLKLVNALSIERSAAPGEEHLAELVQKLYQSDGSDFMKLPKEKQMMLERIRAMYKWKRAPRGEFEKSELTPAEREEAIGNVGEYDVGEYETEKEKSEAAERNWRRNLIDGNKEWLVADVSALLRLFKAEKYVDESDDTRVITDDNGGN